MPDHPQPPVARYPIPHQRFRSEIEVNRSRFITTVQPVTTPKEAQAFVAEMKAAFPDANHNCWAYLIGAPGSTDQIGLSDDGEPHGVAGQPMLTTLQHSGLGDTAVVVTRYFGGIKLGKGGMVKAYTAAVQTALELVPRGEKITWHTVRATLDYALVKSFELRLADFECEILATDYADRVNFDLRLPDERLADFATMFVDLTAGRGVLEEVHG
ncbi:MAG: YigZ family protein [Desulfuromonadaceae bacterium]|nr:YigZ family protein [Desulfuromonadaceae bacterium]